MLLLLGSLPETSRCVRRLYYRAPSQYLHQLPSGTTSTTATSYLSRLQRQVDEEDGQPLEEFERWETFAVRNGKISHTDHNTDPGVDRDPAQRRGGDAEIERRRRAREAVLPSAPSKQATRLRLPPS